MEIKYDKKIDAKYVRIKNGKITHTKKEQDWLLFDCAKNGDVLGVEILDASKHLVSLSTVAGELVSHNILEPRLVQNGYESVELEIPTKNLQFVTA